MSEEEEFETEEFRQLLITALMNAQEKLTHGELIIRLSDGTNRDITNNKQKLVVIDKTGENNNE